jgi:peptide chain release factor subunit 1
MSHDRYIETFKLKKLMSRLRDARGDGTSLITLISPPGSQVSQLTRLLTDEYGTATNIKSRTNRLSVLDAITSVQQRLKLYNKIPNNGLLLFCGTILNNEGKQKRVTIDIEPYKPINTSLYMCDNKFHVEALNELLDDDDIYGFIIMDGSGTLYGTIQGNTRTILHNFSVDLPKKHAKGGQSSVRFARLRMEARHNYIRKVAEYAVVHFISNNVCNVKGIIMAGSADFKTELSRSDLFDQRLLKCVIQIVDISYGGHAGFNQAIQLSAEAMSNVRFIQEKKLLQQFFTEISIDSGKYCFTLQDTIKALEMGAAETTIIWENNPLECKIDQDNKIVFDDENKQYEVMSFVEWIASNYTNYGTKLEFVTDCSTEGHQFVKGFQGIGALLRWKVEFEEDNDINMD